MTEPRQRPVPDSIRTFLRGVRRAVAAAPTGRPTSPRRAPDPFAAYRDLTGPSLVSGPRPRHDVALDADPRIVVLMPHLQVARMSGGPNTIFHVTAPLVRAGLGVRYVATGGPLDADVQGLRRHVQSMTGIDASTGLIDFVDASRPGATLDIGRADVLVATWWRTAHLAQAALQISGAAGFVYLIQDFEPGFYPWSTEYALAAATYDMPIRAIVNEPSLVDHLRATGVGRFVDPELPVVSFLPAVDRTIFSRRVRPAGTSRRLAFYARPKHARNLFDLGLAALRAAAARGVFDGADWEFHGFGSKLPDLPISARHTLRAQPWLDYARYGAYLGETDLLLSLMLSPHTSYPPLEMAVAGGRVVTNTFGAKTESVLRHIAPTIHAAPPALEPLVQTLAEAVGAIERGDAAASATGLPASWDDALRDVTPWLMEAVRDLRAGR